MDLTITAAIAWIKADVAHYLTPQAIKSICRKFGHTWRERILDPVTTVHLFLLQVLHGNTACSNVRIRPAKDLWTQVQRSSG